MAPNLQVLFAEAASTKKLSGNSLHTILTCNALEPVNPVVERYPPKIPSAGKEPLRRSLDLLRSQPYLVLDLSISHQAMREVVGTEGLRAHLESIR